MGIEHRTSVDIADRVWRSTVETCKLRLMGPGSNIANGVNSTSEFQGAFFIILNIAVGGNVVGSPDGSTVFPQQMQVDWVRVWGDLKFSGAGVLI
jgi:hypothetical protein